MTKKKIKFASYFIIELNAHYARKLGCSIEVNKLDVHDTPSEAHTALRRIGIAFKRGFILKEVCE